MAAGRPRGQGALEDVPHQLGPYVIEGVLGSGGSGVVYAARHGDRSLALKVLRPDEVPTVKERQRFVREAEMMARITHPNVVKVHAAGELDDGRPYLAMERLEGVNLAAQLEHGPLEREVALALWDQIASAVAMLHGAGLIHRDLKPENVMWAHGGRGAVLLDFGIAREADAVPSTTTRAGMQRGTPAYMAPERFFGARATMLSDVYELALILYVMLVGRLPWTDPVDARQRLEPTPPSAHGVDLPAGVEAALLQALSSDADERPATVAELAGRVRLGWHAGQAVVNPTALALLRPPEHKPALESGREPAARPHLEATTRASRRGLAAAGAAVIVVVGVIAAIVIGMSSDPASSDEAPAQLGLDGGPWPEVRVGLDPAPPIDAASLPEVRKRLERAENADARVASVAAVESRSVPKTGPARKKVARVSRKRGPRRLRPAPAAQAGEPAALVGPDGTAYVLVKRYTGTTRLPWCRKFRDLYCGADYKKYVPGGTQQCARMNVMVDTSERMPPHVAPKLDANCKNLHGKFESDVREHTARMKKLAAEKAAREAPRDTLPEGGASN